MQSVVSTHPDRARLLGEVHARPFEPMPSPRIVRHVALITSEAQAQGLHAAMTACAQEAGVASPADNVRYYVLNAFGGRLRWEQHSEFGSLTWDAPLKCKQDGLALIFERATESLGQIISMTQIDVVQSMDKIDLEDIYDTRSLCVSEVDNGIAIVATDFRQSDDGATCMHIASNKASEVVIGGLVQRLLEIETYRTLALLGLPLAQSTSPQITQIEKDFIEITASLSENPKAGSDSLLEDITRLSAELEASAAACLFRFGASKAYFEIVQIRLKAIRERAFKHHMTLEAFLIRRLQPAMQTINALEERQSNLSRKLSRAANLLRTRVDVELERQNRDLLTSMNHRAKLQLRLQQTVEGLSIAAISYYVIGLFSYFIKGFDKPLQSLTGVEYIGSILTAIAVPIVVGAMWLVVRRIHNSHKDD
ncbi:MAG: Egg lysin [Hyphomicrobiales bacterium]|nr:MAG: Egg lysin [Hyphomicrobiales bacterium]